MKLKVIVDRPIGYIDDYNNKYPVNYGYVPGIIGGDGEEQDAYIIDSKIDYSIEKYEGYLIAEIIREDDVETKWVVSNQQYTVKEVWDKVKFMEQYFKSSIVMK